MNIDRNTAPIIAYAARPVRMQSNLDAVSVPCEAFINRIIDNFLDHMVQARAVIRIANIHARTLSNRVKAFKNFDAICAVIRLFNFCWVCHGFVFLESG